MNLKELRQYRWNKCEQFIRDLQEALSDEYEMVGSCDQDKSMYLIPKGTIDELSYYGKPTLSFRASDHWNWYANINKCDDPRKIQCYSVDIPWAKQRAGEGKPSTPVLGIQVAIFGRDNRYHHVYGEKFDRRNKTWEWEETDPKNVASMTRFM